VASGDLVWHATRAGRDEGQRARPETGGETRGHDGQSDDEAAGRLQRAHVDDEGVTGRPLLGGEETPHRVDVERVDAEPIHGFGRKGDELPRAQTCSGLRDGRRVRHGRIDGHDAGHRRT
jgi:hypothetical protein